MGLKLKLIIVLLFIAISFATRTEAAWQGPVRIISGTWGSNDDQFGVEYGDTNDVFGGPFYILQNSNILLTDLVNGRIKKYTDTGTLTKVLKCIKSDAGEWSEECRIPLANYIQTTTDGNIWIGPLNNLTQQGYSLYSPTGQLIKTSATWPLELGNAKSGKLGETNYKITLIYPDKVYGLSSDREYMHYVRDTKNFVYGINAGGVWRFNQCGKLTGTMLMPSGQVNTTSRQGGFDPIVSTISEYGEPVVAPDGDIYAWKRTPDNYCIIKWTWVDDPNAPSGPDAPIGLTIMPSTTGLYLTWTASPQDPGCVTGYEVSRATTSGGVGPTVGTVNAGVVKYNDTTATTGTTYYYKIRAVAGSEYSPYTKGVSAKRP